MRSWALEPLESLSRDQLIQVILDQHRMIEKLKAEIEELKRKGGAAPFSKGTRKADPKPPGRKPGQGFFRFRNASDERFASEPILRIPAKEITYSDPKLIMIGASEGRAVLY